MSRTETIAAEFSYTVTAKPAPGVTAVWRKPVAGLSLAEITKIAMAAKVEGSEPLPRVRLPREPDSGKPRVLDPLDYAGSQELPRVPWLVGEASSWRIMSYADGGKAAVLSCETLPADVVVPGERMRARDTAPVVTLLTPEWWRAYTRVRTCRGDRRSAGLNAVYWDGRTLSASSYPREDTPDDPAAVSDDSFVIVRRVDSINARTHTRTSAPDQKPELQSVCGYKALLRDKGEIMSEITPQPQSQPEITHAAYMAGRTDFQTYYLGLADIIGRRTLETIARRAIGDYNLPAELARDPYLNGIPLHRWDAQHPAVVALIAGNSKPVMAASWNGASLKPGTFCWSLGESGCVLKAVARAMAETWPASSCADCAHRHPADFRTCLIGVTRPLVDVDQFHCDRWRRWQTEDKPLSVYDDVSSKTHNRATGEPYR